MAEERFEGLKKLKQKTAGELISGSKMPFQTKIESPREAAVGTVLAEFETKEAVPDMLALLALALPVREAVWWACLAGRDLYPAEGPATSPLLEAAEAWVFKPTDETRQAVKTALDAAKATDEAAECATAALFANGTLGPGELDEFEAPPGVVELSVFGMVVKSLLLEPETAERKGRLLVDRALDIARGGNGRLAAEA